MFAKPEKHAQLLGMAFVCFSFLFFKYIFLFLVTCVFGPHSAFHSTLNSLIVYRIVYE